MVVGEKAKNSARNFIENEKPFHLGFLPTEQSNPLTATLETDFRRSSRAGVETLLKPDRDVAEMAKRVLAGGEFRRLAEAGERALERGGRLVFSGCGATGRLAILLESMWRNGCIEADLPELADRAASIMTGGDYALVKSVEFFEDFASFGRRQCRDLGVGAKDCFVAITEGGETSSVLGTLAEAAERGAECFLLFNNPAGLLAEKLERSRNAIRDPRVTVLDLFCGPMALAGSTRMQATTSEMLIAGVALEILLCRRSGKTPADFTAGFEAVLDQLTAPEALAELARYIDFEAELYAKGGGVTYFANDYALDIFTDTTERSPTFMLPGFIRADDRISPAPWARVADPALSTPEVWARIFRRAPRCLNWTPDDYRAMGAPESVCAKPPVIGDETFYAFPVGREVLEVPARRSPSFAVGFLAGPEAGNPALKRRIAEAGQRFDGCRLLTIGGGEGDFMIPCAAELTPLRLLEHLAVKLTLNAISTGTMVKLGRVSGNWMSFVATSNKKLIDRAIRLIAELGRLEYADAAERVFQAMEEVAALPPDAARPSAVQVVLADLKRQPGEK